MSHKTLFRTFLSCLFLSSLFISGFAQAAEQRIGGFIGLSSDKVRVSGGGFSMSSGSSSSFILGASYERDLAQFDIDNLYLQVDPTFYRPGKGSGKVSYLYVPVLAKYKFEEQFVERTTFSVLAGLSPRVKLSSADGADTKTFGLGLDFGGEAEHFLEGQDFSLFFGARYSLGLTNAFDSSGGEGSESFNYSIKFNSLQFMLGARMDF